MASWKIFPDPDQPPIEYTSFLTARKFFAVDDSGSTAGSISRRERAFVEGMRKHNANSDDLIALWGSNCEDPTTNFDSVVWKSNHWATYPAKILENPNCLRVIERSDVWYLVTDGEIYDEAVHQLSQLAHDHSVLSVPIVFLIVGSRGRSPDTTNISVGISFFAGSQDTLILFQETETGKIYVIAGKGCFRALGGSIAAQELKSWSEIPVFSDVDAFIKHCANLEIQLPAASYRGGPANGTSLGPDWEESSGSPWVDLDILLSDGVLQDRDLFDLLQEDVFDTLAVACKTRRRIPDLRSLVQAQKMEQVAPKLEDVSGAGAIISRMNDASITSQQRKALQDELRKAHTLNRQHYTNVVRDFAGSEQDLQAKRRNQLVDAALRSLASVEAASYNADLISRRSNRARRAEVVSSDTRVDVANLDLDGPAYKGFCLVCCGEEEVMSICLKESEQHNVDFNTADFALNFPLAAGASLRNVNLVSSQNICFQCALLGPSGLSIYKESLKAIIPTVQYEGSNKKYINDQLFLALTAGLQTGAAGVAQLLMAILVEVLKTKSWAGAGITDSQMPGNDFDETVQRRETMTWMLDQLLQNTRTRQTFSEVGDWVKFPEALSWVASDFDSQGLAGFAATYPIAGFDVLIFLGRRTGAFTESTIQRMAISKAVYSVSAKYLADVFATNHSGQTGDSWKQPYLKLLYRDFNSDMVPKDECGPESLVTDVELFLQRLSACLGASQGAKGGLLLDKNKPTMMRKIQLIVFWLVYHQRHHCSAQTFFTKINLEQHLATAVLNPSLDVPEFELHTVLRSIFATEGAPFIDPAASTLHEGLIPFKNPFAPSVLRCGLDACNEPFHTSSDPDVVLQQVESIRRARTRHLIRVYGIKGRFERADTGLPEPRSRGQAPSSTHINLHIGVAREWATYTREKRKAVLDNENEREGFVISVRKRICEQGRGNIFNAKIDQAINDVLPSFFSMLRQALKLEGKGAEDVTEFEHDFAQNTVEWKIRYELRAMAMEGKYVI
ncbi:hypothetical protein P154DRAFT_477776 [Amniculicola lignicola CBS 123094]|uniref:Uncharacterized protein n=1 Tax=Amniculicola lignicola CBS 123094 TaxID=1392246 RepID=A0A6A5W6S1_9PLEO|nr:hypothetical protein P154DRAFT_477776 [Amniculicola lignicola CBS 123094]